MDTEGYQVTPIVDCPHVDTTFAGAAVLCSGVRSGACETCHSPQEPWVCLICGYTHEYDKTWTDEKKAEVQAEMDTHHNEHIIP